MSFPASLTACALALSLFGCNKAPHKASQSALTKSSIHEIEVSRQLTYIIDTQTHLCFAQYFQAAYGSGSGVGLVRVECARLRAIPRAAQLMTWTQTKPPGATPPDQAQIACQSWRTKIAKATADSEKRELARRRPSGCE
jgi:hypothetical protein